MSKSNAPQSPTTDAVIDPNDSLLPKGLALTPFNPAFKEAPHEVLGAARAHCPAYYDEDFARYVILGHDDVRDGLRDKGFFVDSSKANENTFPKRFPDFIVADENSMLSLDNPDHKRLRSLVSKAFTPKSVEAMRPRARAIAEALVANIDADEAFDLIDAFAGPFPTIVISDMLGVSREQSDNFKTWSDTSIRGFFNVAASVDEKAAALKANESLRELFYSEIRARRRQPGEDLISRMVLAQEAGETLTDDEIVTQCNLLLVAGNVTVTDMLGCGFLRLLQNPLQYAQLRDNPDLMANAVEEILRFDPPADASVRIPNRDIEVAGCPIPAGEYLLLSIMAANHDPDTYNDPDRFDIERVDSHHVSFGGGAHFCLGASLARIEGQEAFGAILRRFPMLEIAERGFEYALTPQFRGVSELWVQPAS
ncbi:MAG: cytochrome P450 [Pseudomonadales bacterium]